MSVIVFFETPRSGAIHRYDLPSSMACNSVGASLYRPSFLPRAVAARRWAGLNGDPGLLARVSTLGWAHILLKRLYPGGDGDTQFGVPERFVSGGRQPIRCNPETENAAGETTELVAPLRNHGI